MADHGTLKAQNDAVHQANAHFLTQADGWTVLDSEGGVTTAVLTHNGISVARYNGSVNKAPEFFLKFVAGNLASLRKAHNPQDVGTEYVLSFPDRSHVVKEITNSPVVGEYTSYTYYSHSVAENGVVTLVGNAPDHADYPKSKIWINFFILTLVPTAAGTDYTLVVSASSDAGVFSDEVRNGIALRYKAFYGAIVNDIANAA